MSNDHASSCIQLMQVPIPTCDSYLGCSYFGLLTKQARISPVTFGCKFYLLHVPPTHPHPPGVKTKQKTMVFLHSLLNMKGLEYRSFPLFFRPSVPSIPPAQYVLKKVYKPLNVTLVHCTLSKTLTNSKNCLKCHVKSFNSPTICRKTERPFLKR